MPERRRCRAKAGVLAVFSAAILVLTGCEPNTVEVAFRPPSGAVYRYEVTVRSVSLTRLGDAAAERAVDEATFEIEQTVIEATAGGTRLEVRLRQPEVGAAERTFVVRFNPDGQLAAVESVEGLPATVLGPVGLPEILPAAAGAPPARPLSPGERWTIDLQPDLPGVQTARLLGEGRLVELRVEGDRRLAVTRAVTRLPLASSSDSGGGTLTLEGVETTESESTRVLSDGSVDRATSNTRGSFDLTLKPPGASGVAGDVAVSGTLTIDVETRTRRL